MLDDNTSTSQPSINGPGIDEDSCRGIVQKIEHINPRRLAVHCVVHSFIIRLLNDELQPRKRIGYHLSTIKND